MSFISIIAGLLLIAIVLLDAFETVVLPRTVGRTLRLNSLFYTALWKFCSSLLRRISFEPSRQYFLAVFGPSSLILLFTVWAYMLILGFALLDWGLHTPMHAPERVIGFTSYLYSSGITFFTLGYGDVTPTTGLGRAIAMIEAGVGFGLLAIVIGYLPVIYQAFSRREVTALLLDSRAGSPPTASTLLHRHAEAQMMEALLPLFVRFENWSSELLESFISYPVLAYYRAQHEKLAWLAGLTTILDAAALIQVGFSGDDPWQKPLRWQARQTFALARHVLVDLSYLLNATPATSFPDRLPRELWQRLCAEMREAETPLIEGDEAWAELCRLRQEYEPFVYGLANFLFLAVPHWHAEADAPDSWQTSAWDTAKSPSHF
jgi:hypothetical protein